MTNNFSPDCVTFRRRDFDAALDRHSQINNGRARRIYQNVGSSTQVCICRELDRSAASVFQLMR